VKQARRLGMSFVIGCIAGCAGAPLQAADPAVSAPALHRPAKKRVEPEPVTPVVIGTVRYEAAASGRALGLDQDGGVLRAIDMLTGAELGG
jgi:hypothetical protein